MGYMSDLAEMYGRCLSNKGLIMTEEKFIHLLKKSPLPIPNKIKNQYPE